MVGRSIDGVGSFLVFTVRLSSAPTVEFSNSGPYHSFLHGRQRESGEGALEKLVCSRREDDAGSLFYSTWGPGFGVYHIHRGTHIRESSCYPVGSKPEVVAAAPG